MSAFLWGRRAVWAPSPAAAEALCRDALRRRARAAARGHWKTLEVLHETGRLWADPASPLRRKAQALMPGVTGFSPETVRRTLDILPRLFERTALRRRLREELGGEEALDEGRTLPLGAVLHVAAGNIFLGCIDSVLMSLLTHNVTILRSSSADPVFPGLFAESLRRADRDGELSSGLAIVSWDSARKDVSAVFKRRLQGVVVWGGAEAVASYREGLGPGCRLVAFGPKLSFGVISRAGLALHGPREAARRAARDIVWWDQAACASPQTLFVEDDDPEELLGALAAELARLDREVPPGRLPADAAADRAAERHRALAAELEGRGRLLAGAGWTVAWRRDGALRASPLNRYIQVSSYRGLEGLRAQVEPAAAYLQSAGLLVGPREREDYSAALAAAGASRTPELGRMLESSAGEPHDGRYPLRELTRMVAKAPGAAAGLRSLLGQAAAESPFYRRRLPRAPRGLAGVPLLDKEDLYKHSPPRSRALLTRAGDGEGRVLFASGGSTGRPKFSLYTQREFDATCAWLGRGLRRGGLEPGDVVANLFAAGSLWSSFLAVAGALGSSDVLHLPIAGTSDPSAALEAVRRFKANVIIGLPSTILELARQESARGLRVSKVFYGGEHVTAEMARAWRSALGVRLVRSAGYASVDAGLIGTQCPRCRGSVHHAAEGLQKLEIVAGELVATNLLRRLMPVIRYRTGDRGRWLGRPCPCGDPSPLFELLGRCDDRVNVGGAHLDLGDVSRAVAAVRGLSLFYQAVVDSPGGRDRLTLRVERGRGPAPAEALAERLRAALMRSAFELRDSLERGWLAPLELEVVAPGALPRQPRTGKLVRVVDRRRG
ncbi:MAG: AMP-binding protein [Elusimicrobia bacterium]|nr:AMP-binding protein [Elusimicrobiota bacterium]